MANETNDETNETNDRRKQLFMKMLSSHNDLSYKHRSSPYMKLNLKNTSLC